MRRKSIRISFLIVVLSILVFPGICIDTKPNKVSTIDNRMLVKFPEDWYKNPKGIESYINDRIGFREDIITAYQYTDYHLYGELNHPLYMLGKNGWIYTKEWDSINYQHLDEDEEYIKSVVHFITNFQEYCDERGIDFCFFIAPNKESIYPEYYPDGYNVKDQPNRTDKLIQFLSEDEVNYVDSRSVLIKAKDDYLVCNKKQDAGHWNQNGAFVGLKELYNAFLYKKYSQNGILSNSEFLITEENEEYLINSRFSINEKVPQYTLLNDMVVDSSDEYKASHNIVYWAYDQINKDQKYKEKVLIFGDSYFGSSRVDKFLINHYGEVLLLHVGNIKEFDTYISEFEPDIVIIEAAERTLNKDEDFSNSLFQWKSEWFYKLFPDE